MTQLSVSQRVVEVLSPLVQGRCYQRTFLQPNGELPPWPAIRFIFASADPGETICGDGGDDQADYRLQIDIAVAHNAGEVAFQALRTEVLDAMQSLEGSTPAYVWAGQRDGFDAETKTNRCSLDYTVYQ